MPHVEGAALGGNVKLFMASLWAVLATASAAQCTSVLSIFDPQGAFSLGSVPTQAESFAAVGQTFTIEILASGPALLSQSGPSDLYGYSFDLSFNPADVQVVSNGIQEDGYFAKNGTSFYYSVDNSGGLISDVSDEISGPGPGENLANSAPLLESDTLATITFKAVGDGTSSISFLNNDDLYFVDSQSNFTTPVTGVDQVTTYTLLGSGAPPPQTPEAGTAGTVGVAGIGLLAFGYVRRMKRCQA